MPMTNSDARKRRAECAAHGLTVHAVPFPYGGLEAVCGARIDGITSTGYLPETVWVNRRAPGMCPECVVAVTS